MDHDEQVARAERPYFTIISIAGPLLALATLNQALVMFGAILAVIGIVGAWMTNETPRWYGTAVGGVFLAMIGYYTFFRADPVQQTAVPSEPPVLHNLKWRYRHFDDPIRQIDGTSASTDSSTDFELQPPYGAPNNATFLIGLAGKDWIGLLQMQFRSGQPLCGYHHKVIVKFDDDEKKTFEMNCSLPSDGTTATIILKPGANDYDDRINYDDEKRFAHAIRTARKMEVALEFYQSGAQTVEFNLAGLEFDAISG